MDTAADFIAEWERLRALREASDEPVVKAETDGCNVLLGKDWGWIAPKPARS